MTSATRLYSGLTTALAVCGGPLFLLHGRGRKRLGERFGGWDLDVPEVVWFHGASLGEMNGLLPLMRRWKARFPEVPILATATSTTGLERAEGVAAITRLVPFDSPPFIRRALGTTRVRAFVFGETEIWPGLIAELHRRAVPLCMVNARIGAASARRYQRWQTLFAPAFGSLRCVCASSDGDRSRLLELGVSAERCVTAGNAKYDLELPALSPAERNDVLQRVSPRGTPVLVLGSIRPGEEEWWFPVLRESQAMGLTVVVAPRHPEKFEWFAEKLAASGLSFRRWSKLAATPATAGLDILLLDTLGELRRVYGVADLAFVGGSLVDWGGHNPLEPALLGVPVATGPYMSTVSDVVGAFDGVDARYRIADRAGIEEILPAIVRRDPELRARGERGREIAQRFTGAADVIFDRVVAAIEAEVPRGA